MLGKRETGEDAENVVSQDPRDMVKARLLEVQFLLGPSIDPSASRLIPTLSLANGRTGAVFPMGTVATFEGQENGQ
jgi:hypothetical protein